MKASEHRLTRPESESGLGREPLSIVLFAPHNPNLREDEYDPNCFAVVPGGGGSNIVRRDFATDAEFIATAHREGTHART